MTLEEMGAREVHGIENADFVMSSNNGVFAVYPAQEIKQAEKRRGAYWTEAGKCFCFSDKKIGCLHGDLSLMKRLLQGKKVAISDDIWSSWYVPFSNCQKSGCSGTECLVQKIQRMIESVVEKPAEEIKQEINKELLLQAITIPEVREETAQELGKDIPEIVVFPAGMIWGMLHTAKFCQNEQKFRLPDSELLKHIR